MKSSRGKTHSPGTEGLVLWVSNERPRVRAKLRDLIDSKLLQDCDQFAVQISPWLDHQEGKICTIKNGSPLSMDRDLI